MPQGRAGSLNWTVVRKGADESVASSATLQIDDHLFFTAQSGVIYEVEIILMYASPSGNTTPDFKVGAGEDATATRGSLCCLGGGNTGDSAGVTGSIRTDRTESLSFGTSTTNRSAKFTGCIVGNGGTFAVMWSQATSGVGATILRAGSILRYRAIF